MTSGNWFPNSGPQLPPCRMGRKPVCPPHDGLGPGAAGQELLVPGNRGEGGAESQVLCWAKIRRDLGSSARRPKGLAAPNYRLTARSLRIPPPPFDRWDTEAPRGAETLQRPPGPWLLAWEPPSNGWVLVCLQGRAGLGGDPLWVSRDREGGHAAEVSSLTSQ